MVEKTQKMGTFIERKSLTDVYTYVTYTTYEQSAIRGPASGGAVMHVQGSR
jgi:hypothetical protein